MRPMRAEPPNVWWPTRVATMTRSWKTWMPMVTNPTSRCRERSGCSFILYKGMTPGESRCLRTMNAPGSYPPQGAQRRHPTGTSPARSDSLEPIYGHSRVIIPLYKPARQGGSAATPCGLFQSHFDLRRYSKVHRWVWLIRTHSFNRKTSIRASSRPVNPSHRHGRWSVPLEAMRHGVVDDAYAAPPARVGPQAGSLHTSSLAGCEKRRIQFSLNRSRPGDMFVALTRDSDGN